MEKFAEKFAEMTNQFDSAQHMAKTFRFAAVAWVAIYVVGGCLAILASMGLLTALGFAIYASGKAIGFW